MFIETLFICKNKNCHKNYSIKQYVEMLLIWTELMMMMMMMMNDDDNETFI